ncbi:MAG: hypothetical protein M0D57_15330 [Sphingobacteriales bacterium JAD_PAG50586_3]|nr:MAG: hypothetical protein M0D57_15330 [Sphingobacteriales bacterium JAD_PAG50586_3]
MKIIRYIYYCFEYVKPSNGAGAIGLFIGGLIGNLYLLIFRIVNGPYLKFTGFIIWLTLLLIGFSVSMFLFRFKNIEKEFAGLSKWKLISSFFLILILLLFWFLGGLFMIMKIN